MCKQGTILAVDDNNAILTALRFCLEPAFERVLTLSDPAKILKTLSEEPIDIVLLDMNFSLGVNSGQEGLFWLRTITKHCPETPVVLLTAYGDVQLAVRGLKTGAKDFITKPWDNDVLIRKLRDVMTTSDDIATLDEMESSHIQRAIDHNHGNLTRAAEQLGITRQTLYNKIKRQK